MSWMEGMEETKILDAGYKSQIAPTVGDIHAAPLEPLDRPPYPVEAAPDWSSLMSDLQRSLTRAEDELRLIHMDPDHKHQAKGHLIVSRAILKQLEDWCDGENRSL